MSFYRFFQGTVTHFKEIQDEAGKLSERISAYGKLFEDYKSLENFKSPTQSSPKRRKSSRKINKDKNDILSVATTDFAASPLTSSESNSVIAQVVPAAINSVSLTPCSSSLINSNKTFSTVVNSKPQGQLSVNFAEDATNEENNIPTAHSELRVIPPKKHIFISRFASDTTSDEIDSYVKYKLKMNANITVHKFTYSQQRSITSFKISVPSDLFAQVLDQSFWPLHVLVREYEYNGRQRNIARLPANVSAISKN